MTQQTDRLKGIDVPAPCSVSWNAMAGTEQVRFCGQCQKSVYNLSAMTRRQAELVVADKQGRLCAKFERRADGTILTRDATEDFITNWRTAKRRTSIIVGAAFTTLIGVGTGSAMAQTPVHIDQPKATCSPTVFKISHTQTSPQDAGPAVTGTVHDANQAVIVDAEITLINEGAKESHTSISSDEGTYRFSLCKAGSYTLSIKANGFKNFIMEHLVFRGDEVLRVDATLQVAVVGEVVVVQVMELPLIDTSHMTMMGITASIPPKRSDNRVTNVFRTSYNGIRKIIGLRPR
ncbi:MAG: carboxypeptidase-like regulatory domain-containing protein [Acidobacteriota bacterium]|nr:carboxypeptidase-like regulatory domain-containing protein [Acidobacteriota bacterium]